MNDLVLLLPILLPLLAGLLILAFRRLSDPAREGIALAAVLANLGLAIRFFNGNLTCSLPWCGMGLDFSLRLYQFSSFILLAVACFGVFVSVYSVRFMRGRNSPNQFYGYLLFSVAMVNGAVLSNNLVLLLFFWEGLLLTLFGMIAIGSKEAFKTATKAFLLVGVTDLCMMFGIALTGWLAGTLTISEIHLPVSGLGGVAMIFLLVGAMSKAGAMPFHSWIPDAAKDAPLPFMAILPASMEKLLGIYFLARITLDMYALTPESWVSMFLMIVGAVTILLAVMMALVQKEYKRLLSYHAISQVGYMILGIGTALPVGIVGGLFHMVNHAMYKSCLFLTGGAVEKQAGTTNLEKLGGLAARMPVTFGCFIIAAASISGVPPFNGFFSKELVYDAALNRHVIFYLAAILGSFFTAASFLKLGHAAFLGKRDPANDAIREAPPSMLAPMIVIAAFCVLFGVWNALPLNHLIQPILGEARLAGENFAGLPTKAFLVVLTFVSLGGALLNHLMGVKMSGSGLKAADHIHHSPGLRGIYDMAERKKFDPYEIGLKVAGVVSASVLRLDRGINWIYDTFTTRLTGALSVAVEKAHTGSYALYLVWSLLGAAAVVFFLVRAT